MKQHYLTFFIVYCSFYSCIHAELIYLSSNSFKPGFALPRKLTCQGEGYSPHFSWNKVNEAKSYLVICDDPDAPKGVFTHWILYNIPPTITELKEGVSPRAIGAQEGVNSAEETGYTPPCPPSGTHRYEFTIYALDTMLDFDSSNPPHKHDIAIEIQNHVISKDTITATYQKE